MEQWRVGKRFTLAVVRPQIQWNLDYAPQGQVAQLCIILNVLCTKCFLHHEWQSVNHWNIDFFDETTSIIENTAGPLFV